MINNKTFNTKMFSLSAACEQATKETLACVHWMGRQIQTLFQSVTQFFPFLGKIHQIAQRAFFSKEDNKTEELLSEPLSISNEAPAQNKTQRTWINFCAGTTENIGFMTGTLSGSVVLASIITKLIKDELSDEEEFVLLNSFLISAAATSIGLVSSFFSEAKKEPPLGQTSLPTLVARTATLSTLAATLSVLLYPEAPHPSLDHVRFSNIAFGPLIVSIASLWHKFAS